MSEDADGEVLSIDELTEVLAEATGTSVEDVEKEFYIAPPEEGTVVNECRPLREMTDSRF
jgi:hypothetical protein